MRILLLTRSFNSLTQRLYVELEARGHTLSVEYDINQQVSTEAVELFRPQLIVAPYLTRLLPEAVWRRVPTLVVHPGPIGDRGPAALDRAIADGEPCWGVTLLQAEAEYDAGPVWATRSFAMREASKSSLYRDEVTEGALACVLEALGRLAAGRGPMPALDPDPGRGWRPRMGQDERAIDWAADRTNDVLRKIRAADGQPGVRDEIAGRTFNLFDAHAERGLQGEPGTLLARSGGAVCRATADGAVWLGHLKPPVDGDERPFKMPAKLALGAEAERLPERPPLARVDHGGFRPIRYLEDGPVGFLHFDFYNGAISTAQCRQLLRAYELARARPTRVLVLLGGREFWSNGLNLMTIEAAPSPADESWRNINAIDDLALAIIETTDKLTIAALQGNAGAGGVFLALAADLVLARAGVVLNPHYKNMGNLYGSEYWTYLLPRRVGADVVDAVMGRRLPVGVAAAAGVGLIDAVMSGERAAFGAEVCDLAREAAEDPALSARLREKVRRRASDEAEQPLAAYRAQELERMKLNFYGFDPSYHVARYHFITKVPLARTPVHLAKHREIGARAA